MYAFRAGVTVGPTLRTIVRGMDNFHADGVVARPPLATRPGVGMLDSEPHDSLPLAASHLVAWLRDRCLPPRYGLLADSILTNPRALHLTTTAVKTTTRALEARP